MFPKLAIGLLTTATLGLAAPASSFAQGSGSLIGSVTVRTEVGVRQNATGLFSGVGTTGEMMAGMTVRATFADGTSEQAVWQVTGVGSGAAAGTGWQLSESGDTFTAVWRLSNNAGQPISSFQIDGGPAGTLFDTTFNGDLGTEGSGNGRSFTVVSGLGNLNIVATYIDATGILGAQPVGDIFRRLIIAFENAEHFGTGGAIGFRTDTDSLEAGAEVSPDDCCEPWDNGRFDSRTAQTSQEGIDPVDHSPFQRITADDFWLCPGFEYRIFGISGTMTTNSLVPKARVLVYADCDGTPGTIIAEASSVRSFDDTLAGTVTVTEAGGMFDGFRLITVDAHFDKLLLRGGAYWVSIIGFSGTGNPLDQFFWGSSGNLTVKGRPGQFYDSSVGGWESIETLCCGCTDFNFCVDGDECKVLLDNGAPVVSGDSVAGAPGLTSLQNGSRTSDRSRAADQFVVPPCESPTLCEVTAYLWTNCTRAGLEIYGGGCHCPTDTTPIFSLTSTCLTDVGARVRYGGVELRLKKVVFADFMSPTLNGGRNYWLSVFALGDGSQNARGFFACGRDCNRPCGHFDPACMRAAPYSTSRWLSSNPRVELAFSIAVVPTPVRSAGVAATPACAADFDRSGSVSVQDIFGFLAAWFVGCP